MFPLHFSPVVVLMAFVLCILAMGYSVSARRVLDWLAGTALVLSLGIMYMFAYDMGRAAVFIIHH